MCRILENNPLNQPKHCLLIARDLVGVVSGILSLMQKPDESSTVSPRLAISHRMAVGKTTSHQGMNHLRLQSANRNEFRR